MYMYIDTVFWDNHELLLVDMWLAWTMLEKKIKVVKTAVWMMK